MFLFRLYISSIFSCFIWYIIQYSCIIFCIENWMICCCTVVYCTVLLLLSLRLPIIDFKLEMCSRGWTKKLSFVNSLDLTNVCIIINCFKKGNTLRLQNVVSLNYSLQIRITSMCENHLLYTTTSCYHVLYQP